MRKAYDEVAVVVGNKKILHVLVNRRLCMPCNVVSHKRTEMLCLVSLRQGVSSSVVID